MTHQEAYAGIKITQKTHDFLKQHSDQKYTAMEIATWIFKNYPKYVIKCTLKEIRAKDVFTKLSCLTYFVYLFIIKIW